MAEYETVENVVQRDITIPPGSVEKSAGILDIIKENLAPGTLLEKIKTSKDRLFEATLYGGIGLISGFLLKKYSTYVGVCVLLLIGLGVLHHLEVVHVVINWDKVNELFGIQAAHDVTADNIISVIWEWVKINMLISISYIVGFFIGLKVG